MLIPGLKARAISNQILPGKHNVNNYLSLKYMAIHNQILQGIHNDNNCGGLKAGDKVWGEIGLSQQDKFVT